MRTIIVGLILGCAAGLAIAQERGQDQTRQIVAEEFASARPKASASASKQTATYRVKKGATGAQGAHGATTTAELGVTVWRLREQKTAAGDTRLLIQDEAAVNWVPERIDVQAGLAIGDRVRLAFESPRAGYLYVLDREEYADGSSSPAYLIFPTTRTRGGDNAVRAGRLIEIPAREDRPSYFTVRRSRPDQVAEVLSAIVSSTPIPELPAVDRATEVAASNVLRWETAWSAPTEELAQVGTSARGWSEPEARAGVDAERLLTQDDPMPQTIYRVRAKAGQPLLVHVRLPYGATQKPQ
jgi:hypothetical protein